MILKNEHGALEKIRINCYEVIGIAQTTLAENSLTMHGGQTCSLKCNCKDRFGLIR